jgi:hypothetical protein
MFGKYVYPCTDIFMISTNSEEENEPNKRKRGHILRGAHTDRLQTLLKLG